MRPAVTRCFAAVEFDDGTRERLRRLLRAAREQDGGVRWVRPAGLHATLAFLGDQPPEHVQRFGDALEAAGRGRAAIPVQVGGLGGFPSSKAARVVFVGVTDPTGGLLALHADLAARFAAAGFVDEERAFHPHVTLGRVRDGKVAIDRLGSDLDRSDLALVAGSVTRVVLFRSDLEPGGAVYTPLRVVNLGDSP